MNSERALSKKKITPYQLQVAKVSTEKEDLERQLATAQQPHRQQDNLISQLHACSADQLAEVTILERTVKTL